jgi:hypothetical protein
VRAGGTGRFEVGPEGVALCPREGYRDPEGVAMSERGLEGPEGLREGRRESRCPREGWRDRKV